MDLHDNQLESLPDTLSDLTRLTRLNLGHNRLTDLPRAIYSLKELQVLQMNNNQIEIVDEKICEVNMLNNLNLAHNKIKVKNYNKQRISQLSPVTFSEPARQSWIFDEGDSSQFGEQLSGEHSTGDFLHDGTDEPGSHQQQSVGNSLDPERFESFR